MNKWSQCFKILHFCKNSSDSFYYTRVDKGNVVVAMNREVYIKKIKKMLINKNHILLSERNPILNIERNFNNILNKWFPKKIILINELIIH